MSDLSIKFPLNSSKNGVSLTFYKNAVKKLENHLNKMQKFQDKKVSEYLMAYVSFRDSNQSKSIKQSTVVGSGYVIINVKYASYQAYSNRIKKKVGKRGTKPFERMVQENKTTIMNDLQKIAGEL
jgi:hypothetical protein